MSASVVPERRVARLDVEQVHAMLAAGILGEAEPIELIDGVLVYKDRSALGEDPMTIGRRHNLVVKLLASLDPEVTSFGRHLQTQGPLSLPPHDEPEPDGVILRGGPRDYTDRLPLGDDADVVIEVADASLSYDRTKKLALYARAGIAQYAIVNLQSPSVELHEEPVPADARYRRTSVLRAGDTIILRLGDGRLEIAVARILP